MNKSLFTLLISILYINTFACINEHRTLLSGEIVHDGHSSGKVWTKTIDTTALKLKANTLWHNYIATDSLEYLSDYGAALIYLGKYTKAKSIYEQIEHQSPDLYTTASNLGTLYELTGKPDSALIWIKKSIELNPKSHDGSEWVHIKILKFKLSDSKDYNTSILGLSFGEDEKPTNPNNYNLKELQQHIWHQLTERSRFVKPTNLIVGNIYFDLGNILAQTRDVQSALKSYEAAKEYGFESELMNERINKFESMTGKANTYQFLFIIMEIIKANFLLVFFVSLSVLIGFIFLVIKFIKKRKNLPQ